MPKPTSSAPSQRMLRVAEQVRSAVTQVLQRREITDPVIDAAVVSISEVRMSPDLKVATAFVTPLGSKNHDEVVAALNRNAKYIRGKIGPSLRQMKFMPEIRFKDDTSFENFRKIDALLKSPEVQRDLGREDADEEQG
ncbi:MAG: rbfA [Rhizobium sp.]|nr:rbfA [Rhizobium sp.]